MKKLPLGIQTFEKIVKGDYVYVDKTEYVYELIDGPCYLFLSRPRRFGKSLLLDTVAEAFKGNKELFRGLWIYDSGYAFAEHPVIRFDMSKLDNETPAILKESIMSNLRKRVTDEGLDIDEETPADLFSNLIEGLNRKYGQGVVVLIDEYDKPILDHLHNIELAEENRRIVRSFYGILKSMDAHLRFVLITGVSKFSKTSIFSELNNLTDITLTEEFAGICGIPCDDLDRHFGDHIRALSSSKRFQDYVSVRDEILAWYDGYSWDGESRYINPFSLLSFFKQKRFVGFWYSSGSPKFLIDFIKRKPESFLAIKNLEITEFVLDTFDINKMELEPLLFQTGYLTVKEVIETGGEAIYLMEIPNYEVRNAFNLQVLSSLTESGDALAGSAKTEIGRALEAGDLQKMLVILRRLFASIPHNLHVRLEAYYHSIFYAIMTVLGFDISVEVASSRGVADAVLELRDKVYVMEFKYKHCEEGADEEVKRKLFDKALDEAMEQIKDRGYHRKHVGSGKDVILATFAFLGRDDIEMRVEG